MPNGYRTIWPLYQDKLFSQTSFLASQMVNFGLFDNFLKITCLDHFFGILTGQLWSNWSLNKHQLNPTAAFGPQMVQIQPNLYQDIIDKWSLLYISI